MKFRYVAKCKRYPGVYFNEWYYNKKTIRLVCTNELTGFNSINAWKYRSATVPVKDVEFVWRIFASNKFERRVTKLFAKLKERRLAKQEKRRHLLMLAKCYDIKQPLLKLAFYRFINWCTDNVKYPYLHVISAIAMLSATCASMHWLCNSGLSLACSAVLSFAIGLVAALAITLLLCIPAMIYCSRWYDNFTEENDVLFDEF